MTHGSRALLEIEERTNSTTHQNRDIPTFCAYEYRQVNDHSGEGWQVCAKSLEQIFEGRDNENQKNRRNDKSNDEDRSRIGQCLLDFLFQCLGFFFLGCNLVKQGLKSTGLFACLDEVDEQVVKIQWVLGQSLG